MDLLSNIGNVIFSLTRLVNCNLKEDKGNLQYFSETLFRPVVSIIGLKFLYVLLFQVLYETHGFLEKNRDFLHSDLLQLLASCDCVLAQLFAASIGDGVQKMQSPTRRVNIAESQKQSVATKFKVCAT